MRCPECGEEILAGHRHCSNCDYEMTPEEWREASRRRRGSPKPALLAVVALVLVAGLAAGGMLLLRGRSGGGDRKVAPSPMALTLTTRSIKTYVPTTAPTAVPSVSTAVPAENSPDGGGTLRVDSVNSTSELVRVLCKARREGYCTIYISNWMLTDEEVAQAVCFGALGYAFMHFGGSMTIRPEWFPGVHISQAVKMGDESALNSQEQALLQQARAVLDSLISPEMSDLEKECAIHDYIIDHAEYLVDESLSTSDAVGFFEYGKVQCSGYTDTFYLLASLAGLEVDAISGDVVGDDGLDGHSWNLIRLDGLWYALDVTWDDHTETNLTPGFGYFLNFPNEFFRVDNESPRIWNAAQEPDGRYATAVDGNWFPGILHANSVEEAAQVIANGLSTGEPARVALADGVSADAVAREISGYGYYDGYVYCLYDSLPGLRVMEYIRQ